jgi:hypothetical protein
MTYETEDAIVRMEAFLAATITRDLSPNGKEITVSALHGKAALLLQHLMDLGELAPELGYKAAAAQNGVRQTYNTMAYAIGGKVPVTKAKDAGIQYRAIAERCEAVADYWQQHGEGILKQRDAVVELVDKDVQSILDKQPKVRARVHKPQALERDIRELGRLLGGQDKVARKSEFLANVERGTAELKGVMAEERLDALKAADKTLRVIGKAFRHIAERYDRDVVPVIAQLPTLGPDAGQRGLE